MGCFAKSAHRVDIKNPLPNTANRFKFHLQSSYRIKMTIHKPTAASTKGTCVFLSGNAPPPHKTGYSNPNIPRDALPTMRLSPGNRESAHNWVKKTIVPCTNRRVKLSAAKGGGLWPPNRNDRVMPARAKAPHCELLPSQLSSQ